MRNIISFEEACSITGDDVNKLPNVEGFSEIKAKRMIADHKLSVIHQASNGDWKADFNDDDQYKYTPWLVLSPSAGAFVYARTIYTFTGTRLGARFWFEDENTAKFFGHQHIALINDLHRSE